MHRWKKLNRIHDSPETTYSYKGGDECDVNVPDLKMKRSRKVKAWDDLNKKLEHDPIVLKYPKVRPKSETWYIYEKISFRISGQEI